MTQTERLYSLGAIAVAAAAMVALLAFATVAGATQRISRTGGFDNSVYAMTPPDADGNVVVGGAFRVFNAWDTGASARVDLSTGSPDASFPKVGKLGSSSGTVYAAVSDGTGGYFIGGSFECVGGDGGADSDCADAGEVRRYGLAHINADGSIDEAWEASTGSSSVTSLARSGTTLYAGGTFTRIGGFGYGAAGASDRNNLAALSTATGAVLTWNPNANGQVNALILNGDGTKIYVGGNFSNVGGQSRNRIAELDTAGAATSWNPNANNSVYALARSGTTIYVGGAFTNIGGQTRNRVAAIGSDGLAVSSWDPNVSTGSSAVYAVAVSGSTIYIGGNFTTVSGATRNRIAAIGTDGTLASWNPDAGAAANFVYAIAVDGTTIYAGGTFSTIGGQPRNKLAALKLDGTATDWDPNVLGATSPSVQALLVDPSTNSIFVGGLMGTVGGTIRNRIAQLDANGALTSWNPNADDIVRVLVRSGSSLYVGGDFLTIGGQTRNRIAALNVDGTASAWNPSANRTVWALALDGSTVFAGGEFDNIGGQSRKAVAALKADGTAYAWDPFTYGAVYTIVADGGIVYLGGNFSTWGGPSPTIYRRNLAAFRAGDCLTTYTTAACLTSWDPSASSSVNAMSLVDGTMYVGGYFGCMHGPAMSPSGICPDATRSRLAAIQTGTCVMAYTTSCLTSWNPSVSTSAAVSYPAVWALAATSTAIYAGGDFTSIGSAAPWRFSKINRTTGEASTGPPVTPTATTATAGDGQATVSWTASTNATSYTATSIPAGGSCTTTTTSCTVTGLTNGTTYTFTVTASSAGVYTSAASDPTSAVVPQGAASTSSASPSTATAPTTSTPRPSRTPPRAVFLTASDRRQGIPVSATGAIELTLRCPAKTGTCTVRGALGLPTRRTTRLVTFSGVRVRAGQRTTVTVNLPPETFAGLQALGPHRMRALLTVAVSGAARSLDVVPVTLRIPGVQRTPPVTG